MPDRALPACQQGLARIPASSMRNPFHRSLFRLRARFHVASMGSRDQGNLDIEPQSRLLVGWDVSSCSMRSRKWVWLSVVVAAE